MQSGNKSPAYVGDVPTFWDLIKKSCAKTKEIIEDADQDGFGIGIIYKE